MELTQAIEQTRATLSNARKDLAGAQVRVGAAMDTVETIIRAAQIPLPCPECATLQAALDVVVEERDEAQAQLKVARGLLERAREKLAFYPSGDKRFVFEIDAFLHPVPSKPELRYVVAATGSGDLEDVSDLIKRGVLVEVKEPADGVKSAKGE